VLPGPFVADLPAERALHLAYVRSPHASARLVSVDVSAAAEAEGVVAVFVAGALPIVPLWEIAMVPERYAQPALADGDVRYVGERVAVVVATSEAAALDAAELVVVTYEPRRPVADVAEGEPCLEWPSLPNPPTPPTTPTAPTTSATPASPTTPTTRTTPTTASTPAALSRPGHLSDADVTVAFELHIPRLSVAPMEGHAVLAVPDGAGGVTVWASTQVPTAAQRQLCRSLGLAPAQVRVVAPAVGGGFGGKAAGAVPDHAIAAAIALRLGWPVRYVEDRPANLMTMQGRGVRAAVSLSATHTGTLTGLHAAVVADAGAYPNVGAVEPGKTQMMACGPYRLRAAAVEAKAVVTNLPPVGAYRGPGRAEASMMLERAVDMMAAELGIDPLELRLRNVLAPDAFPYTTPTGVEYDSGDYGALLRTLAAVAGYQDLRARQRRRREGLDRHDGPHDGPHDARPTGRGPARPLLGIGTALVVDSTAWFARTESAGISLAADGVLEVRVGTASAGQRHDALYRAVVRSVIPVADAQVRVIESDTAAWAESDGTMGSRTAQMGGGAVWHAARDLDAHLRTLAARELEASPADIVFHTETATATGYGVRGVPSRALTLSALARAAGGGTPEARCTYHQPGAAYPAAAHLSVVEVDVETGSVRAVRHVAVTDCGTLLDPQSAHDQVVGATVQGIAQALFEEAVFDADGAPRNASLADYAMPTAADVPSVEAHFRTTPSPRNPLGAKGVGEIGMLAAPVAVQNAVVDALRPFGVRHLDVPCTPERVWSALSRAPHAPR
jgi:carbon-monoxide dehydrogenase large subunit